MPALRDPSLAAPLEELAGELEPIFRSVFGRFRIPPEDAEDILQDAFLAFLKCRAEIRDPEAWLFGTLRNRCRMYWRARHRRICDAVDDTLLETLSIDRAPSPARRTELRHDLDGALSRIPERCRALLELRYGVGCELREAGERLGYKPSGIYKIMDRCLTALTRQLVGVGYGGEAASHA